MDCRRPVDATSPRSGDWWGRAVRALGARGDALSTPHFAARPCRVRRAAPQRSRVTSGRWCFAALGAAAMLTATRRIPAPRRLLSRRRRRASQVAKPARGTGPRPGCATRTRRFPRHSSLPAPSSTTALCSSPASRLLESCCSTRDARRPPLGHRRRAGRGPSTAAHFDQQPIEVAAIADACARAFELTGDPDGATPSARRGPGSSATTTSAPSCSMPETGAGYDGLEPRRPQREPRRRVDARRAQHLSAGATTAYR